MKPMFAITLSLLLTILVQQHALGMPILQSIAPLADDVTPPEHQMNKRFTPNTPTIGVSAKVLDPPLIG